MWKKRWLSNSIGLIFPSRTQRHKVIRLIPRYSAARVAVNRSVVLIVISLSVVTVTYCNIVRGVCQVPVRELILRKTDTPSQIKTSGTQADGLVMMHGRIYKIIILELTISSLVARSYYFGHSTF